MRPRTCRRYCKYGFIFFLGYLLMQGVQWMSRELMTDTDESIVIHTDDEIRSPKGAKIQHKDIADRREVKKEFVETMMRKEDEEDEEDLDVGGHHHRDEKKEDGADKYRQAAKEKKEAEKIAKSVLKEAAEAKADAKAKDEALKLEQRLRREEELRHEQELKHQEGLLRNEEAKREEHRKQEEARRRAEAKKQAELKEELGRLQKELEKKHIEPVGPGEDVVHDPSMDRPGDEHYKYSFSTNDQEKPVHGRHFAMKSTRIEHDIEEEAERHMKINLPHDHFPVIVTAVTKATYNDVEKVIDSVQYFLPGRKMVVFHIDLSEDEVFDLETACNVETRLFWMWMFPSHVYNSSEMSWRPVIMQLALAEFGSIIWINPTARLVRGHFEVILKESQEEGLLTLSSAKRYSTFSVTHPQMYTYLPTNINKMKESSHLDIRLMIIHNTRAIQENLLKWLILCSLEKQCLVPEGSRHQCDSPVRKETYANCHSFDGSALNLLLKNYFSFQLDSFNREDTFTMHTGEWKGRPQIKRCH